MKTAVGNPSILFSVLSLLLLAVPATGAVPASAHAPDVGAVFIMSNSAAGNNVLAYSRGADGALTFSGAFATNGLGTGAGLGNQGGLALAHDGEWLVVVNPGSNEISVFRVDEDRSSTNLVLSDKVGSGGLKPTSVSIHDEWVYVLNAGTATIAANIAGFHLSDEGTLSLIHGSVQPLSGVTQPAQISFNPEGTVLVVTEKSTNLIDAYLVNDEGVASGPITNPSHGATPFGFAFDKRGHLIVSEAPASALSSYSVSRSGDLTTISGSIADGGAAACWVVVAGNGRFAYTSNTHSNTISSYTVNKDGTITLLQSVGATTGASPTDMALSKNSRFLYVSASGANEIQGFAVHPDGTLTWVQTVGGIPAGADGLAAN